MKDDKVYGLKDLIVEVLPYLVIQEPAWNIANLIPEVD